MNACLLRFLAVLLLFGRIEAAAFDPCPVCGGKVIGLEKAKDDRSKPSKNDEFFPRSTCGVAYSLLGGAVICSRCGMGSRWFEEEWTRASELPGSFIPPLEKSLREFPKPSGEDAYAAYCRRFDSRKLTDSVEMQWDETIAGRFAEFRQYCKQHGLVMELRGEIKHPKVWWKEDAFVVTDKERVNPSEMEFVRGVSLVVKAEPKVLYEKPLPPKRPMELRAAKAEFARSAETLRVRYINELLRMRQKDGKNNDDLAERAVEGELMKLALPKESNTKELTKLLIGKWKADGKSENRWGPIVVREGVWNQGYEVDEAESAPWHFEGNQLVCSFPKREDGSQTTRRLTIILLNATHLVCVEEKDDDGEIRRDFESWERIPDKKRR